MCGNLYQEYLCTQGLSHLQSITSSGCVSVAATWRQLPNPTIPPEVRHHVSNKGDAALICQSALSLPLQSIASVRYE